VPTTADRLSVLTELELDMSLHAPPARTSSPPLLIRANDAKLVASSDGCTIVSPTGPQPTAVFQTKSMRARTSITFARDKTLVALQLERHGQLGPPIYVPAVTKGPYTLRMTVTNATIRVSTAGIAFTICGATLPAT
jgi:hypothetical protein